MVDIDDSRTISFLQEILIERIGGKLTSPFDYISQKFADRKEIFRFILTHPYMDHRYN